MSDIRRMLHCKVTSPLTLPVAQFCLFRYVHLSETRGGGVQLKTVQPVEQTALASCRIPCMADLEMLLLTAR